MSSLADLVERTRDYSADNPYDDSVRVTLAGLERELLNEQSGPAQGVKEWTARCCRTEPVPGGSWSLPDGARGVFEGEYICVVHGANGISVEEVDIGPDRPHGGRVETTLLTFLPRANLEALITAGLSDPHSLLVIHKGGKEQVNVGDFDEAALVEGVGCMRVHPEKYSCTADVMLPNQRASVMSVYERVVKGSTGTGDPAGLFIAMKLHVPGDSDRFLFTRVMQYGPLSTGRGSEVLCMQHESRSWVVTTQYGSEYGSLLMENSRLPASLIFRMLRSGVMPGGIQVLEKDRQLVEHFNKVPGGLKGLFGCEKPVGFVEENIFKGSISRTMDRECPVPEVCYSVDLGRFYRGTETFRQCLYVFPLERSQWDKPLLLTVRERKDQAGS